MDSSGRPESDYGSDAPGVPAESSVDGQAANLPTTMAAGRACWLRGSRHEACVGRPFKRLWTQLDPRSRREEEGQVVWTDPRLTPRHR